MLPILKNNAAAGYQSPVRIELLKGASLLPITAFAGPANLARASSVTSEPATGVDHSFLDLRLRSQGMIIHSCT